ncbi:HAMP domain-containing sensor histidine kinase [Aquipuribacter nitratireducens]|uniref:Signal transduction histidine-protein kinase/phosphatase MprB n=1 Tax=Aquipuribacter nitratireducens TaxID=650104 RepID=A0ABW0GM22_9MICO
MSAASAVTRARRLPDLRPLDPVRSVKAKLALVVVGSLTAGLAVSTAGTRLLDGDVVWVSVLALAVAVGLVQVLAHGMTSPLRQMTQAARAMAAGEAPGPAVAPVATTSRDEVGELARAFTAMARDLEDVDRQRRELLADVAHELRTPVAALRAQLENLVDGVRAPDPDALGAALHETERLGDLVEDLLGLARSAGTGLRLEVTRVPVLPAVEEVVALAARAHPGSDLRTDVAPDLVAWADARRLRQVLTNLVDNACRHGSPDGLVLVSARPGPAGAVVLDVHDDGPGIPDEQRQSVFDRFRRGTGAQHATPPEPDGRGGGTGLGLAIVRWAVELHGGRVAVLPGDVGCRVRVLLPGPAQEGDR